MAFGDGKTTQESENATLNRWRRRTSNTHMSVNDRSMSTDSSFTRMCPESVAYGAS